MSSLKDDELSRRIFYAGMFGLPWLWLVHAMGYQSNKPDIQDPGEFSSVFLWSFDLYDG
jgi:hypothetical protein